METDSKSNMTSSLTQRMSDLSMETKMVEEEIKAAAIRSEISNSDVVDTAASVQEDHMESLEDCDVRVAIIGNVDSGKSTLVGCLTRNTLDDGRGDARSKVFNYAHEQVNGRTSSIAHEIMGFDADGDQVVPDRSTENRGKIWNKVTAGSSKLVTFIDLCGHEKYLKTTIFGLSGMMPDYALIVVGANMGVSRMTREHLGIALRLKIPIFIAVTKVDIAPPEVYQETLKKLKKIMKEYGGKLPIQVTEQEDVVSLANNLADADTVCPIFTISNVTGEGLPQLREFLSSLNSRAETSELIRSPSDPAEFVIDGVYLVQGVGICVSGTMRAGTVRTNDQVLLGPDKNGAFKPVIVKCIHYKRSPIPECHAGQSICFNIRAVAKKDQLRRTHFRKGMVLVDRSIEPRVCREFEIEAQILHHATTIKDNYQAVIHCSTIRQSAKVVSMSKELVRTGDTATIRFRFMYNSEYVVPQSTVLFREGRTRGIGYVSNVIYEDKKTTI